jgi:hypothetical protein
MEQGYGTVRRNQATTVKKNLRGLQYPIQQSKFTSEPAILAIFSSSDRIGSLLRLDSYGQQPTTLSLPTRKRKSNGELPRQIRQGQKLITAGQINPVKQYTVKVPDQASSTKSFLLLCTRPSSKKFEELRLLAVKAIHEQSKKAARSTTSESHLCAKEKEGGIKQPVNNIFQA